MSGHSKWSKIKRQKGLNDKQKGAVFSKLSRLITLAVSQGSGSEDLNINFRLRLAVEKAKAMNMPKETIDRAIKKAKEKDSANLQEIIYEGFVPGGVAVLILVTTDNPNRSSAVVRNVMDLNGGKLGVSGSAMHYFRKEAVISFVANAKSEEELFAVAERFDAYDIETVDNQVIIHIPFTKIGESAKFLPEAHYQAILPVEVANKVILNSIYKLFEELEGLDDVHSVFSNVK